MEEPSPSPSIAEKNEEREEQVVDELAIMGGGGETEHEASGKMEKLVPDDGSMANSSPTGDANTDLQDEKDTSSDSQGTEKPGYSLCESGKTPKEQGKGHDVASLDGKPEEGGHRQTGDNTTACTPSLSRGAKGLMLSMSGTEQLAFPSGPSQSSSISNRKNCPENDDSELTHEARSHRDDEFCNGTTPAQEANMGSETGGCSGSGTGMRANDQDARIHAKEGAPEGCERSSHRGGASGRECNEEDETRHQLHDGVSSPGKQSPESTRFVSLGRGLAGGVLESSSSDDSNEYIFEKMPSTRYTNEGVRAEGRRQDTAEAEENEMHPQDDEGRQHDDAVEQETYRDEQQDSVEEEEQTSAVQMEEEEDDHNYEITDFSLATPWERLVRDVEDVLNRWGLADGGLGSGWDTNCPPTREHTILNSSKTRGVMHRCEQVQYRGVTYLLRHVCWLPEGMQDGGNTKKQKSGGAKYAGLCGVEALWNKRSSAATTTNYVHEVGCCLGVANYVIFVPDDSRGGTQRVSMQEVTALRSTLAIAIQNVRCVLCGITPTGPRGTPSSFADFPYTFHGFQSHRGKTTRFCCYLDAQVRRVFRVHLDMCKKCIHTPT
jgi:hypothetical protein